jgi:hypothetical protein
MNSTGTPNEFIEILLKGTVGGGGGMSQYLELFLLELFLVSAAIEVKVRQEV